MEKAKSNLDLVDLSKKNFRRTLNSLEEGAHSLLLLKIQSEEIEGFFDSTKTILEERGKELETLEESLKAKALELEAKEKELCSIDGSLKARLSDLEKAEAEKRKGEVEQLEILTKRIESIEKVSDEKLKELDAKAKELELNLKEVKQHKEEISTGVETEPLVSLLAKSIGLSSVTTPTKSPALLDSADDLVKKNAALSRLIPYLDPAKLVLEAIQRSFKESYDGFDSVVNSCVVLLEKLIQTNPKITPEVKQEATQLGIDRISKAENNPNNYSRVLSCLLFLAAYGLASVTTREVVLNLLEHVLLYDQAPKLFRLLGLEDNVFGVVETLREKEEYFAAIKFVCEFELFKLFPGALLLESLNSSENVGKRAWREKIKADAVMAIEYIKEKKLESKFPLKAITRLIDELKSNESPQSAMKPVHRSDGNGESKTNIAGKQPEAKRQRAVETKTPNQNSTGSVALQADAKASYPLRKPNIRSGFITAEILRELIEKQPLEESDLNNALRSTPDSAKLVLDTSMSLCPTKPEGSGYEFKLLITSASCSLLLNQLKNLKPQIRHPVKADAKKLAVYWKDKISKSKADELEVICFLEFLGIFGIVSDFKASDLLGLLDNSYWRTVSPDLCKFLGLDNAIPDFIQNLIKTGYRLKAIDYIYSFDMVHRFQPVSAIIKDSLRITKESTEKAFKDAKNESSSRVAAIDRQIKSLRAAIRCITCYKLESDFQIGNLNEQIKSLLKHRRNTSESEPDLAPEAGSITRNIPSEPSTAASSSSISKPQPSRGQKRSLSGNIESSGHVSSNASNHFRGHGYALNQRQTWPVDHYQRGFVDAPNSSYNYNQRTQLGRPQSYPFHQHFNPFYRNH